MRPIYAHIYVLPTIDLNVYSNSCIDEDAFEDLINVHRPSRLGTGSVNHILAWAHPLEGYCSQ